MAVKNRNYRFDLQQNSCHTGDLPGARGCFGRSFLHDPLSMSVENQEDQENWEYYEFYFVFR